MSTAQQNQILKQTSLDAKKLLSKRKDKQNTEQRHNIKI